ncbi:P-TEFB associated cyclin, cyclin T Pch1 [Halteromyces radiatus]|uniref:P-TEFB associated cyclin, cyclin T Pch1 n=1 Tax=Halteromyces radiatus TaxID=101107 RepID=UPI00221ECE7E|nr:P-TEFB associated cyclin, cyclin T Pch1 [Halteromyces radiatus]KAI8081301.1 P-TEFB associated cyclin, cyclin T Pch1 [Halteromyces radiatus]
MEQWFFSREELQLAPTIAHDGVSISQEHRKRAQGCAFIQTVGCRLAVPQITVATAMVYFHRFYMRCSFNDYNMNHIGGACIYLACKVEESSRKVSDVTSACLMARYSRINQNDEKQKLYQSWRSAILWYERFLLETLCFDMTVDHPHQLVLEFAAELDASESVTQAAYGFANDSLRRPLCLTYDPQMIAAACMLLSYRALDEDIPTGTDTIWGRTLEQEPGILAEIIGDLAILYNDSNYGQSGSDSSSSPNSPITSTTSQRRNGHTKSILRNGYTNGHTSQHHHQYHEDSSPS